MTHLVIFIVFVKPLLIYFSWNIIPLKELFKNKMTIENVKDASPYKIYVDYGMSTF